MKINGVEYEFILVGDSDKYGYKECLVCLMGHNEEQAKERFDQMMSNPTKNDVAIMEGQSNFRLKTVKSADAWWNDPFLAN